MTPPTGLRKKFVKISSITIFIALIVFISFLTCIVAAPSTIKVFSRTSAMGGGPVGLKPPLLCAVSFIFLFMLGGFTGLTLGAPATKVQFHSHVFINCYLNYIKDIIAFVNF